jgi:hypothetical protein
MKRGYVVIATLLLASCALRCGKLSSAGGGDTASLLPITDISGWTPSGAVESVSNTTDLWKWDDGAEQVFVDHNFTEASRRIYSGTASGGSVQLRLRIYALRDSASAQATYNDTRSGTGTPLTGSQNPGREARLDESAIQALTLEYWKSRYFVRVVIEENSLQAKNVMFLFASNVASKIP